MIAQEWCPYPKSNAWDQSKSRKFVVQLDGLNELFSNAPATDRNVLAEFILTEIKTKHLEKVGDLHAHRNALLPQGVSLIRWGTPEFTHGDTITSVKVSESLQDKWTGTAMNSTA